MAMLGGMNVARNSCHGMQYHKHWTKIASDVFGPLRTTEAGGRGGGGMKSFAAHACRRTVLACEIMN